MKYKKTQNYKQDRQVAEEIGLCKKSTPSYGLSLINRVIETRIRIGNTWYRRVISPDSDIVYYIDQRVLDFKNISKGTITGYGKNTPEWKKK